MALTEAQKRKIEEEELFRERVLNIATSQKSNQKHGVPALLSFFIPGLGQMVKGQVGKGIGILIGFIFSFILVFTIIGAIVPIIIWIWQIADAYSSN